MHTIGTEDAALNEQKAVEETLSDAIVEALGMLERWEKSGMKIDLKAAAEVFEVDAEELKHQWQSQNIVDNHLPIPNLDEYYSRYEIQEVFYRYANGRHFRIAPSKAHFRLQQPSDIPLPWTYFKLKDAKWRGFECTRARYNLVDNTISACDIGIEIDFSRSDYTSAVELGQILVAVLKKHEIFCFIKFDGDEILELIIPAEALPQQIDGQQTAR